MELGESKKYNLDIFAREYYGFTADKRSTRNSPKLRNGADIVVIKRQADGNYTFWSPDGRKGSIIDFVMWREHCDAKAAVHRINEILQGYAEAIQAGTSAPPPELSAGKPFDRSRVERMTPVDEHPYLNERGITLVNHGRFRGTVLSSGDHWNNVIFPHCNFSGEIVGYTMKNHDFFSFAEGGCKTVWASNRFAADNRLVICEAAVDALSYGELLYRRDRDAFFHTRFISTDGGFGPNTENAIVYHLEQMPAKARIIAAFDHDAQGWKYVGRLYTLCETVGREMAVDLPKVAEYDWNDVLRKFLAREIEKKSRAETLISEEVPQCAM